MPTATAQGKTFNFPDGTSPEQMGQAIDEYFATQQPSASSSAPIEEGATQSMRLNPPGVTDPLVQAGKNVIGAAETGATILSGALADPTAGIAGLATLPFAGPDKAAAVVKGTKDFFTHKPFTESGQEQLKAVGGVLEPVGREIKATEKMLGDLAMKTGSPAIAALASSVPTALMEAAGIKASRAFKSAPGLDLTETRRGLVTPGRADIPEEVPQVPTQEGIESVAESLSKSKPENIPDIIQPDADFYRAADELGISAEPLASFASKNPQFRAIEQGLASIPASELDVASQAFIRDTAGRADDIIRQYGGTTDKAELSTRFRQESMKSVDDIYEAESRVYDAIDGQLPKTLPVEPKNILSFLEQKITELGGINEFAKQNPRLAKMYNQLKGKTTTKTTKGKFDFATGQGPTITSKEVVLPTHELLNSIRREVGQQIGRKGDTTFKNTETGLLKAVYSRLKRDQADVARNQGLSEVMESADALTIQRKGIEDNLKSLLGKDLQKDLMTVVSGDLKGLSKGNIEAWRRTMQEIPERYRSEAAVSALNDIFRGAAVGSTAFDATQFTKFMNNLNRSPAAKAELYRNLPEGTPRAIENLNKVASGISTALKDRITTGRVSALFDENQGLLSKMMGKGVQLAATAKAGPLAGMVVGDYLAQTSSRAKQTSNLLASPAFQDMMRKAANDDIVSPTTATKSAEAKVMRSPAYKKWLSTMAEPTRKRISEIGLVLYLNKDQGATASEEARGS